jgi:hypothetical protein
VCIYTSYTETKRCCYDKQDADPDSACHFDADPDPTFHFDADPAPSYQINAQNLDSTF